MDMAIAEAITGVKYIARKIIDKAGRMNKYPYMFLSALIWVNLRFTIITLTLCAMFLKRYILLTTLIIRHPEIQYVQFRTDVLFYTFPCTMELCYDNILLGDL